MHFKRLRLNGFKSFVDPAELLIEEGVTGIVGPNGCGKSNLLEALRWVMGESSAKSMRGSGMDDVIFAGTDRRPPRPYAEVILTLDNRNRTAPAQFNTDDTLEVSRRITRDMGSTYRLNGKEVRAKDLQILFADAATGANSPALVRQGQISQLIHAKPKQRRVILEEAAGIGGLYTRRHEAELRLKAANQNLERLEDILKTTETRLGSLRRQAKQAEKYRIISSKIRRLEAQILSMKYQMATSDVSKIQTELDKIKEQLAVKELEASRLNYSETELTAQIAPLREELTIAGAVLKRTELESITIQGQLCEAKDKIHRLERAQHNIASEKDRETQLANDAETVLIRIKQELSEVEFQQDDEPEEIDYLNSRLEVGKKELLEAENELDNLRAKISELTLKNQSLNENLDRSKARKTRLEEQFLTINTQEQQARKAIETDLSINIATQETEDTNKNLENIKSQLEALVITLETAKSQTQQTRDEMQQSESIVNKLNAEIKGLAAIVERKQVKGTAKNLEKISVSSGYEKAFGAAIGDELDFDDDPSQPCYWRLLQGDHQNIALPAGIEPLAKYITVPDFLQSAMNRIGIVPPQDAEILQNQLPAGAILVSKCGKSWRSDGFTVRDNSHSAAAIMLEQRNKLAELRTQSTDAQSDAAQKKHAFDTQNQAYKAHQTQEQQLRQQLREAEKSAAAAERKFYEAENNLKIKQSTLDNIIERHEMVSKELADADQALQSAIQDLEKVTGTDDLKARSEELKTKVTDKRMSLADARALLETKKRAGQERAGRIKTLKKDLTDWQKRFDNAKGRISEAEKKISRIENDLNNAKKQPHEIEIKNQKIIESLNLAKQRHQEAEEKSLAQEGELSVVSKKLRQLQADISKDREAMVRQESYLEAATTKEAEILEQITLKVESTPENLRHELECDDEELQDKPLDFLEQECQNLNRNRDVMGAVNLLAEKELEEVEAESLTMINEKDDLLQAIRKLNAAIKDINSEGREKILTAFENVHKNFKHLFTHLFSGGQAELKLVESDDPLEAGLEIIAQPPGKKTASLSLLSGGEQALTCMALIFAVFLTNPSPICVLDEVDAPLDDANVERYCNLINEMTKVTDTRFLVITHHSLTMARTDRLFGVTMAERGVSQLVSVDINAAEKLLVQAA